MNKAKEVQAQKIERITMTEDNQPPNSIEDNQTKNFRFTLKNGEIHGYAHHTYTSYSYKPGDGDKGTLTLYLEDEIIITGWHLSGLLTALNAEIDGDDYTKGGAFHVTEIQEKYASLAEQNCVISKIEIKKFEEEDEFEELSEDEKPF
jgi:hypothetical protein